MDVETALRNRRSVRGFLPYPVPQEVIARIFRAAQHSPSNCNVQPWTAHVVQGETLKRIAEAQVQAALDDIPPEPDFIAGRQFTGVHRERQFAAAATLYGAMGIERHDRDGRDMAYRRNLAFFGAPHAVFLFFPEGLGEREAVDIGIYAQSLMLKMTEEGLASCAQGALALYCDLVREHLGVTPENKLILGISFGYEDAAHPANATRTDRAALEENVVHHW